DAWSYTLDAFGRYLERVMTRAERTPPVNDHRSPLDLARDPLPDDVCDVVGLYVGSATRLGERTAELHLALAAPSDDPSFSGEPFGTLYQRSLYQSMRSLAGRTLRLLRDSLGRLDDGDRELATGLLERREPLLERFTPLLERKLAAMRLRTHGDFHLG